MKRFLNDFMEEKRKPSPSSLKTYRSRFLATMAFAKEAIGDRPFRPDRSFNVAVFDAVAPAMALAIEKKVADPKVIGTAYRRLLTNKSFIDAYVRATADAEKVNTRVTEARKAFGVL
jgi:hypothetical protein